MLCIIDYGSGNLRSVAKAFEHVAPNASIRITADARDLSHATRIVLPGVGAFGDCIAGINALAGMREALENAVRHKQKPFLGICVGMQMMLETGHENGTHAGLGWIEGEVKRLAPPAAASGTGGALKIPHMGWNDIHIATASHPAFDGIKTGDHAYFVHSYHAHCTHESDVLATVDYGTHIAAVIGRGTMLGTQFHPEKSQALGLRLIENFLKL